MLKAENFILLTFSLFIILASILIYIHTNFITQTHYLELAKSIIQGSLSIPNDINIIRQGDYALYNDKYYVYFGPFPALISFPILLLPQIIQTQHLIALICLPLAIFMTYKILSKIGLNPQNSAWLTIAVFTTNLLQVFLINITAYQAQAIAFTFLTAAFYEFFHKRRYIIIGFFLSLAIATRLTYVIPSLFFFMILSKTYFDSHKSKQSLSNFLKFTLPILATAVLLFSYNYLRFGNLFDSGYAYNASWSSDLYQAAQQGIFSANHIPTNIYFLLFKGADPVRENDINFTLQPPYIKADPWGMSILLTLPIVTFALLANFKKFTNFAASLTIATSILPMATYYGVGIFQYGYRYAIDFYPFLLILLADVFKHKLPTAVKILIAISALFNLYLMQSIWNSYPLILR